MVTPVELSFAVAVAVASATGLVALLLLVADPRRNWNQWLAFFLLLVSGNFAAQAAQHLLLLASEVGSVPLADATRSSQLAASLGWVVLVFDPAVLVYFASLFPRRTAFTRWWWGPVALGVPVLVFTVLEVAGRHLSQPSAFPSAPRLLFGLYLASCYLFVAWRLLRNLLDEPSSVMARQVQVVTLGVMIAIFPRLGLVPVDAAGIVEASHPYSRYAGIVQEAMSVIIPWVLTAIALVTIRSAHDPGRRGQALGMLRVLAGVLVFLTAYSLLFGNIVGFQARGILIQPFSAASGAVIWAVRWFAFSAAMVVGVLRYQVLAVELPALRPLGLVVGGVALAVLVGLASSLGGTLAAAVLAASLVPVALLLSLRRRPLAAASGYLHDRSLEVYRAMLAAAVAEGAVPQAAREGELRRAREQMRITDDEHDALLALAQAEERGASGVVLLGRFEVLRRLGAGGYASVYLAKDRTDGSLKVLKRTRQEWVGDRAFDAALRELEVARRVSHPNIIGIHEMVRLDDGAVVVLEYAEGGSLRDLLRSDRKLSAAHTEALLREALAGLSALHEAGIVHGDLKPENLLLTREGHLKLTDFGTARAAPLGRTLVHATLPGSAGTLAYMAPEQVQGRPAAVASDLYALGAVAYEMLAGKPYINPGEGSAYEAMRRVMEGPRERAPLPPGWDRLVSKALAPNPAERFRSAAEMLGAIDLLLEPPAATERLPRWRKKGRGV